MKESVLSLLLVLLAEAISAIASYLRQKLMRNVNRGDSFDFGSDAEFA